MKIKNIKINCFGNLENKEINLENNINIIYGKNESGKSTLLNYIKNIFYGISKNKNKKEISDYDKYSPWLKQEFSGKISYQLDNGKTYEVFRDFHKRNPVVLDENFSDITTQFEIDKKVGSQFFIEHTKVDEDMFLSTVVSMQEEVRLDKTEQSLLVQRLANLAGSGDDNVSFQKVIDKLNKRQLEEVGTDRTQGRPINIIKNRMKEISIVIKDIKSYQEQQEKNGIRKQALYSQLSQLTMQQDVLKKMNELYINQNIEEEKNKIKEKIKDEIQQKIQKIQIEKEELLKNKIKNSEEKESKKANKKNNKIKYVILFFIILIFCIILKIINFKFLKNNIIDFINYLIIPIYLIIVFFINKIKNNKEKKFEINKDIQENQLIEIQLNQMEKQIDLLEEDILKQTNEINQSKKYMQHQFDLMIEKLRFEYQNKIDITKILDDINQNNLIDELEKIEQKINIVKLQINELEIKEKNDLFKMEEMVNLQEEYEMLKQKLEELEKKNQLFYLTKEYLEKAYYEMKRNITPKFMQNLSFTICEISNGKYTNINLDDENRLLVENQNGQYIPIERLSTGTIDQLYLSLRLSMIEEISEEKMPILLDEAFAYYDDVRLENILKYFIQKLNEHQLILFTCTKREKEILDKLRIPYNLVEL